MRRLMVLVVAGIALLAVAAPAAGQDLLWLRQFGTSKHDAVIGVATDSAGDVYAAGATWGVLSGGGNFGAGDGFLRKYTASGAELWTVQFGTSAADAGTGVAVDGSGTLYVAGFTEGTLSDQASAGGRDAFLRRHDAAGNMIWSRQFGSAGDDEVEDVAVDSAGNVYVVGTTTATLPDQTTAGSQDGFVRAYDASGGHLWTRQFGTTSLDQAFGIGVDGAGTVYVGGATQGTLPGQPYAGYFDAYVRAYDSTGAELWTHQFGTPDLDTIFGVAVDPLGDVIVGGQVGGALPGQVHAGETDAFVRKYDSTGAVLWTRQYGTGAHERVRDVAVDESGRIFAAAWWLSGLGDLHLRRYEPSGFESWTRQFGTQDPDFPVAVAAHDGNGYLGGWTVGTFAGQAGMGEGDAFVVRVGTDPTAALRNAIDLVLYEKLPPEGPEPDPDPWFVGEHIRVQFEVRNEGRGLATGVAITQTLPQQVQVRSASRGCAVPDRRQPQTLTCQLPDLAPGASAAVSIEVEIAEPGELVSSAEVAASERDASPDDNTLHSSATALTPAQGVDHLGEQVTALTEQGALGDRDAEHLHELLQQAGRTLEAGDRDKAGETLRQFSAHVRSLVEERRLSEAHGQHLGGVAERLIIIIGG